MDKMKKPEDEKRAITNDGILFCSGMIAGEGLVGILLALLAVFGLDSAWRRQDAVYPVWGFDILLPDPQRRNGSFSGIGRGNLCGHGGVSSSDSEGCPAAEVYKNRYSIKTVEALCKRTSA